MRLEGTLDGFGLPDVFALLSATKKTGGLHVVRDPKDDRSTHGGVWFTDGQLVGGEADCTRAGLARRVAATPTVDADALRDAVSHVADSRDGLLPTLLERNAFPVERLAATVIDHLIDTVFELLLWTDGEFRFVADEPHAEKTSVRCSAAEVVAAAREHLTRWSVLRGQLPDDHVLAVRAAAFSGRATTTPAEADLLCLLDGQRSVADVIELVGLGRFAVTEALIALRERGLVGEAATILGDLDDRLRRQRTVARLDCGIDPLPATATSGVRTTAARSTAELPVLAHVGAIDLAAAGSAPSAVLTSPAGRPPRHAADLDPSNRQAVGSGADDVVSTWFRGPDRNARRTSREASTAPGALPFRRAALLDGTTSVPSDPAAAPATAGPNARTSEPDSVVTKSLNIRLLAGEVA